MQVQVHHSQSKVRECTCMYTLFDLLSFTCILMKGLMSFMEMLTIIGQWRIIKWYRLEIDHFWSTTSYDASLEHQPVWLIGIRTDQQPSWICLYGPQSLVSTEAVHQHIYNPSACMMFANTCRRVHVSSPKKVDRNWWNFACGRRSQPCHKI
jgi:hypothetical protein